jgi:hypothetical protein
MDTNGYTEVALVGSGDTQSTITVEGDDLMPYPGSTYTYSLILDTTGASAANDDNIQVHLTTIVLMDEDTGEYFKVQADTLPLSGLAIGF